LVARWKFKPVPICQSSAAIASQGFQELPISIRHGQLAGSLPLPHRDPWDRLLIAQAILDSMSLVSREEIFDQHGVTRLW
jgi:PIN domain nuclease of toxin-antitoxin system